jgi:cysteine-rich repeat protein
MRGLACVALMAFTLSAAACNSGSNTQGADPVSSTADALTDASTTPSTVSDAGWTVDTAEPALNDTSSGSSNDATSAEGDAASDNDTDAEDHGFGAPCDSGDDCYSGLCTEHMGDTVCTKTCDEDCPTGWSCESVISGGDPIYLCVSSFEHLCRPCMSADDCLSESSEAACLDYDGQGGFCGAGCDGDADCPEGFACQESVSTRGGSSSQCVNIDGVCECSAIAIELGLATACSMTNTFGTCGGLRTCSDDGLSECDAATPSEELCNGLDDDCDGATDDVPCDDLNPCTTDSCAGEAGCSNIITPGEACDDDDPSTRDDACNVEGQCSGFPIVCPTDQCILESTPNGTDCETTYKPLQAFCDDGDVSTNGDICDGAGSCQGTPYVCEATQCEASASPNGVTCDVEYWAGGTACDDEAPDTAGDTCDGQGGCAGTPYICEPTQCEAESVADGTGCVGSAKPVGIACDDGEAATKFDACDGLGTCVGQGYSCDEGQCITSATPNGTDCDVIYTTQGVSCDDGDVTTEADQCDGQGACVGSVYACTPSQCEATSVHNGQGCTVEYWAADQACDDGDPNTQGDTCDGQGACVGTPYACEPTQCEDESVPDGGGCAVTHKLAGIACDDGDVTTNVDKCDGQGGCGGTPYACEPTQCEATSTPNGSGCDVDYWAEGQGCDDADDATSDDRCDGAGSCAGTSYACAPGLCELASVPNGADCDVTYAVAGAACDDGQAETMGDQCDDAGGCEGTPYACVPEQCDANSVPNGFDCDVDHHAAGTLCDDGDDNTKGDACDGGGACVGETYGCAPAQCEAESVADGDGCAVSYVAEGVDCDDGDDHTLSDQCDGMGGCGGTVYICEPTQCETLSVPDGVGCVIQNAPAAIACDDGDAETKIDICDGFGDCAGTPYTCEADQCDAASTPNGTDCTIAPKAAGIGCDDSQAGTKGDVCDGASGCGGTPYTCEAGLCQTESVPDGVGCDITYAEAETPCDDTDPGTKVDHCDGSGGCTGTPYSCEPSQCEASSTPNGVDCDVAAAASGLECDDGEAGTKGDHCDGSGGCTGTIYACTPGLCEDTSEPDGEGCTVVHDAAGVACDDTVLSTKTDICDGSGGCAGEAYTCDVGVCQTDSVTDGTACDITYAEDGAECDDEDMTTVHDVCDSQGGCAGVPPTCGDSEQEGLEGCDDGNAETDLCAYGEMACTVCDANCALVDGALTGYCGDGATQEAGGETCDDANTDDDDGCTTNCEVPWGGDGPVMWLRADRGVTLTDDRVSAWGDQSGHGNDASQTSAGKRPALATDWHNGRPAVRFDGVDEVLALIGTMKVQALSFFVVFERHDDPVGIDGHFYPFTLGGTENSVPSAGIAKKVALENHAGQTDPVDALDFISGHSNDARATLTNLLAADRLRILTTIAPGTIHSATIFANGVPAVMSTTGSDQDLDVTIGATGGDGYGGLGGMPNEGHYTHVDVAEVLVFDAAVNSAKRVAIETYLADKYGLVRCGDGVLDTAGGEACDDGNAIDDDGCSSSCTLTTPCGETGAPVPGAPQCDELTVLNPTGAIQTFVIPAGVVQVTIEAKGASGGDCFNTGDPGGFGGVARGTFGVDPGDQLQILVGEAGMNWEGIGNWHAGSGGGASYVSLGANLGASAPLIVAGGGGGASQGGPGEDAGATVTLSGSGAGGTDETGAGWSGASGGAGYHLNGHHNGEHPTCVNGQPLKAQAFINGGAGGYISNFGCGLPDDVRGGFGGGGSSGSWNGGGGGGYIGGNVNGLGFPSGSEAAGHAGTHFNAGDNAINESRGEAGDGQVKIFY